MTVRELIEILQDEDQEAIIKLVGEDTIDMETWLVDVGSDGKYVILTGED